MNLHDLFEGAKDAEDFAAGTTIFDEGTPGDVMYVILDGEVEVRVGGEPVEVMKPGDILGEMALIDSTARCASAVAKTDCRLAPCNQKRFLFMVQQTPFFSLHVMRVLADRLRRMNLKRDLPHIV